MNTMQKKNHRPGKLLYTAQNSTSVSLEELMYLKAVYFQVLS